MEIKVELGTSGDVKDITALMQALAQEEGGQSRLTKATLLRQMQGGVPELLPFVAKTNDVIIGTAIAYIGYDVLSATRGLHLSDIYVVGNYRRLGVGQALMQAIADYGLKENLEWISWTVLSSNATAKSFYDKLGASHVGVDFMALGVTGMKQLCSAA